MKKEKTISADKCVYFSQGQKLTHQHLNSINEFTIERSALLGKALLSSSIGILEGVGSELNTEILKESPMSLVIKPGAAVNLDGHVLSLQQENLIRLDGIASPEKTLYYIQLLPEESLESPYTDDEIPELKGFAYKRIGTKIVVSKKLDEKAVEIARVMLTNEVSALRSIESDDDVEAGLGAVDTRHASKVRIFSANQVPFKIHYEIQHIVSDFRALLHQMKNRFQKLENLQDALMASMLLEAEVADSVLAFEKIKYYFSQLRRSLLSLLEETRELTSKAGAKSDMFWTDLFNLVDKLVAGSKHEAQASFQILRQISVSMADKLMNATTEEERRVLIQQAIRDLREQPFSFHSRHVFGGSLFRLAEHLDSEALVKRISTDSEFSTQKTIRAKYEEGQSFTAKGLFYSEGHLHFKLSDLNPSKDCILLMKLYKRRGNQEFSLILNGKKVSYEKLLASQSVDRFLNFGALIDGNLITASDNQVTIDIHNVDLDFGVFGIWAYQLDEGVTE